MNPLTKNQEKLLGRIGCDDLARKVNELVKHINGLENMAYPVLQDSQDTCKNDTGTYGVCDCPEPCQLHKETEWEARERVGEKPFNKTEKAVKEERKRIGEEFKKWFNGDESNEDIEDTIERICGVKC